MLKVQIRESKRSKNSVWCEWSITPACMLHRIVSTTAPPMQTVHTAFSFDVSHNPLRIMSSGSHQSWLTRTTLMHMTWGTFTALKIHIQLWSEHLCGKEEGFHRDFLMLGGASFIWMRKWWELFPLLLAFCIFSVWNRNCLLSAYVLCLEISIHNRNTPMTHYMKAMSTQWMLGPIVVALISHIT